MNAQQSCLLCSSWGQNNLISPLESSFGFECLEKTQQFNLERDSGNLLVVRLHLTFCSALGFSVQIGNSAVKQDSPLYEQLSPYA